MKRALTLLAFFFSCVRAFGADEPTCVLTIGDESSDYLSVTNATTGYYEVGGALALDYVHDFRIDAFSVVPVPCDDPKKERHELRFTMGLREGDDRRGRTVTLENAKVTVVCNDEALPVVLEKPTFTNGVCEWSATVETDKADGRARLFRLKLDSCKSE